MGERGRVEGGRVKKILFSNVLRSFPRDVFQDTVRGVAARGGDVFACLEQGCVDGRLVTIHELAEPTPWYCIDESRCSCSKEDGREGGRVGGRKEEFMTIRC